MLNIDCRKRPRDNLGLAPPLVMVPLTIVLNHFIVSQLECGLGNILLQEQIEYILRTLKAGLNLLSVTGKYARILQ